MTQLQKARQEIAENHEEMRWLHTEQYKTYLKTEQCPMCYDTRTIEDPFDWNKLTECPCVSYDLYRRYAPPFQSRTTVITSNTHTSDSSGDS